MLKSIQAELYKLFKNRTFKVLIFVTVLLSSMTSLKDGEIPLTFILVAVLYMGQQVYQAIFLSDNVSNLTHILGGIVGAGMGYLINKNGGYYEKVRKNIYACTYARVSNFCYGVLLLV